jgi:hypothetical protein
MPNYNGIRCVDFPPFLNLRCEWCKELFVVTIEGRKRTLGFISHPPATCSHSCQGKLNGWRNQNKRYGESPSCAQETR